MGKSVGNGEWALGASVESLPSGTLFRATHTATKRILLGKEISLASAAHVQDIASSHNLVRSRLREFAQLAPWEAFAAEESKLYLFYDCTCNGSLHSELEYRVLSFDEGLQIGSEVTLALLDLHTSDLLHGRICAENVLLLSGGNVKVIEYGISPVWEDPSVQQLPYLDPLITNFSERHCSSDIYALGILLYRIATGALPFEIGSRELLLKRPAQLPPPVGRRASTWPVSAFEVIKRCTTLDRNERFKRIGEVREALRQVAIRHGVTLKGGTSAMRRSSTGRPAKDASRVGIVMVPDAPGSAHTPGLKKVVFTTLCVLLAILVTLELTGKISSLPGFLSLTPSSQGLRGIVPGKYSGEIAGLERDGATSMITLRRTAQGIFLTLPGCSESAVDSDTGYLYCKADAFLEVNALGDQEISGTVRIMGRDLSWKARKAP